jgi:hypothetical protein
MTPVKFTVDGVDGEFVCDADEVKSYKTIKQFARGDDDPAGIFDAMERMFPGHDEEYMERLGGDIERMNDLCNAAMEAVKAKNSSASSRASKSTGTK